MWIRVLGFFAFLQFRFLWLRLDLGRFIIIDIEKVWGVVEHRGGGGQEVGGSMGEVGQGWSEVWEGGGWELG